MLKQKEKTLKLVLAVLLIIAIVLPVVNYSKAEAAGTTSKKMITVNFINSKNGAVSTRTLPAGSKLGTLPTAASITGYTFNGWYYQGSKVSSSTIVSSSTYYMNITTQYTANTYKVKLNGAGKSYDLAYGSAYGSNIDNYYPSKDCYKFVGWNLNGKRILSTTKFTTAGNVTLEPDYVKLIVGSGNNYTANLENTTFKNSSVSSLCCDGSLIKNSKITFGKKNSNGTIDVTFENVPVMYNGVSKNTPILKGYVTGVEYYCTSWFGLGYNTYTIYFKYAANGSDYNTYSMQIKGSTITIRNCDYKLVK